MNILITGGSGFLGSSLCKTLSANADHQIYVHTRNPDKIPKPLIGIKSLQELTDATPIKAIINLTGEPIADKKWSEERKRKIIESRVKTTDLIVEYCQKAKQKPEVFLSVSAIGFYGIANGNELITESDTGDESFSSLVCKKWETAALKAKQSGIRTCIIRTGIVLGKNGGALSKMLLPFKLGLGGRMGNGKQWMPWIHIEDVVGIFLLCLNNTTLSGPINATAPNPVTNRTFTKVLGKVLKRPTVFPLPAFAIKVLMGQMGEELLLSGRKVVPVKAKNSGYQFKFPDLEYALKDVTQ